MLWWFLLGFGLGVVGGVVGLYFGLLWYFARALR